MQIDITILGTSGSTPTKSRGMPSVAITYGGTVYLFDCGEGTQMQMLKYGINTSKISHIFISHMHGDHIIGVIGLLRTMALNNREHPLYIYVPSGYEKMMNDFINFDNAMIRYKIEIKGVKPGIIYKDKEINIRAFRINHTVAAYGYVFAENDSRRFIKEKCKRLGIKGEMFSELEKKGSIIINKRKVSIESVTEPHHGKRIVYASDTRPAASTITAAKGAELLIHEATYSEAEGKLAYERKHSTASEAALVAKKAKVKMLVLTHISARYRNTVKLQEEAQKIFSNTIVAKDGTRIRV